MAARKFVRDDLDSQKYRALQKLAKDNGIKANLPKAALIEELLKIEDEGQRFVEFIGDVSPPEGVLLESSADGEDNQSNGLNKTFTPKKDTPKTKVKSPKAKVLPAKSKVTTPKAKVITPKAKINTTKSKVTTPKAKVMTPKAKVMTPKAKVMTPKARVMTPKSNPFTPRMSTAGKNKKVLTPISEAKKADPLRANFSGKKSGHNMVMSRKKKAAVAGSAIPKFVSKPAPNFAKIHAEQFEKMDSLDVYLSKKKDRTESMRKKFEAKSKLDVGSVTKDMTKRPPSNKGNVETKAKKGLNLQQHPVRRSPRNNTNSNSFKFAPSNLTLNEKNFNFSSKQVNNDAKKPFVFTASPKVLNNITNSPASKKAFDLKASLARPLAYKPHKGKLKTVQEKKADGQKLVATKKTSSLIKGVRMNKRAELLMQRRKQQMAK